MIMIVKGMSYSMFEGECERRIIFHIKNKFLSRSARCTS